MACTAIRSRLDLCGKAVFVNTPTLLSRCVRTVCSCFDFRPIVTSPSSATGAIEQLERRSLMSVTVDAGGLDPTFGAGGITAIDLAGNLDQAHAMALAPDGKLVIGGTSSFAGPSFNSRAVLVRLNSDGTVDTSFGDNGQLVMPELRLPANPIWPLDVEDFTALAVQADGKIVAAGPAFIGWSPWGTPYHGATAFAAVRFNTDGTFDQSFGTNGIALADFSTAADTPARLLVAPDGKILVAGSAGTTLSPFDSPSSNYNVFGVARFTADGVLDDTFGGGDGMATVDFTTGAFSGGYGATAITLVGNRIVVAGVASQQNAPKAVALARLNDDGTFDAHFGAGGRVLTINSCTVSDLMADADGSVLVAESDARGAALVARYTRGGQLDAGFGTDGVATTSVEENLSPNRGYRFTRMADGNVAVAGATTTDALDYSGPAQSVFVCVLDAAGWVVRSVAAARPAEAGDIVAVEFQPDGMLLAAGNNFFTGGTGLDTPAGWLLAARFDVGDGFVPVANPFDTMDPGPDPDSDPEPEPEPAPEPQPAPDVTPGEVTTPSVVARMQGRPLVKRGRTYRFKVVYSSDQPMDASALASGVAVSGPSGFGQAADPARMTFGRGGSRVVVRYRVNAPGGAFDAADNGTYTVELRAGVATAVTSRGRALVSASGAIVLGEFQVSARARSRTSRAPDGSMAAQVLVQTKWSSQSVTR
jgi:uncharacterized delta-60 repeat protein